MAWNVRRTRFKCYTLSITSRSKLGTAGTHKAAQARQESVLHQTGLQWCQRQPQLLLVSCQDTTAGPQTLSTTLTTTSYQQECGYLLHDGPLVLVCAHEELSGQPVRATTLTTPPCFPNSTQGGDDDEQVHDCPVLCLAMQRRVDLTLHNTPD